MAERKAIASGLSLSENGCSGGCWGAGDGRRYWWVGKSSWGELEGIIGVIGEYGGAWGEGGRSSCELGDGEIS